MFAYFNLPAGIIPGAIYNKSRRKVPPAALLARARAHAAYAQPTRPLLSVMLAAWAQDAKMLADAPDRDHFIRLAEPGEAYASSAGVHIRRARILGAGAFECLVHPVPPDTLPLFTADVGEAFAADGFRRARCSPNVERGAVVIVERGRPKIMGLRVRHSGAEPCALDVVRCWWRHDGADDRIDPAWLARAALVAGGVVQ